MIETIRSNDDSFVAYSTSADKQSLTKTSDLEHAIHPPLFTPTSSQYTQTELTCSKMKTSFLSDLPLSPQSTSNISPDNHMSRSDRDYYEEKLNDSRNIRPHYRSVDEVQIDDSMFPRQTRLQQSVS